jgi:DNA-binding response OmpR family regulator
VTAARSPNPAVDPHQRLGIPFDPRRAPERDDVMTKPTNILIVDDEPNIILSLQFLMAKAGYAVRTAKDGEQALAEIARERPDLVLLDVMMPKIDGFTVCQRIRSTPEWSDVRVIMLTARGRDVEREKGLALGADDYITKPFSTKDAIERVAAVLAKVPPTTGA